MEDNRSELHHLARRFLYATCHVTVNVSVMDYERFVKQNIDLDRLLYEDFRHFPYLLWPECWILSNCQTLNTR